MGARPKTHSVTSSSSSVVPAPPQPLHTCGFTMVSRIPSPLSASRRSALDPSRAREHDRIMSVVTARAPLHTRHTAPNPVGVADRTRNADRTDRRKTRTRRWGVCGECFLVTKVETHIAPTRFTNTASLFLQLCSPEHKFATSPHDQGQGSRVALWPERGGARGRAPRSPSLVVPAAVRLADTELTHTRTGS